MQPPVFRSPYYLPDQHQSLTYNNEDDSLENDQNNIENMSNDLGNNQRIKDENNSILTKNSYLIKFIAIIFIIWLAYYLFQTNTIDSIPQNQSETNELDKNKMTVENKIQTKFDHNQITNQLKTQQQATQFEQKITQKVNKVDQQSKITFQQKENISAKNQATTQSNQQKLSSTQPQLEQKRSDPVQNLKPQEKNNEKNVQEEQNEDDQFSLNFVETQFQGKQTQQSLAAAAFAKMQTEINKLNKIEESNLEEFLQRKKLLQDISTLQVMIPDRAIEGYVPKDFYYFSVSIQEMILNSQLQKMYRNGQTIFKISLKQHMRAIIRTQLVHNVNFKGEIQVNLSPFDKGKEQKIKAIKEIIQDESLYYQSLYELSKYNKDQLRFCLVVPSYNNVKSKLYLRNLDSIFMQDYQNYHVVYVDDASPDHTGQFVEKYIKEKKIPQQKIKLIINQKNQKALYNIYSAIHSHCPNGQIVGLIDGDDSLLGTKVLQLYNAVYQSKKTALLYSNFLKILTNNKTSFGFGTQITKSEFRQGKLRNDLSLVGTHFMTFFSDIFKKISKDDLCYDNGIFYDYAYDRAIITPLIQMAYPRVEYLPQVTYEYRNDTGINDGTADWERVSKIIMHQQPYEMLQQFPFIDNFIKQKQQKAQIQLKKTKKENSNLKNNNQKLPQTFFKQNDEDDQQQED